MSDIYLVYSMFAHRDEAVYAARNLLELQLAACVNLHAGIESFYRWEGQIQHAQEVMLLAKTTAAQADAVIAHIKSLHSYELPCIVALPIEKGLPAFLQWVADETKA